MLVRDADTGGGLEVAMIVRTLAARFAGGALVFPGGKVDAADSDPHWNELVGIEAATAPAVGVAAAREAFEETGLILSARPLDTEALAEARRVREAVTRQPDLFHGLVARLGGGLGPMLPFAHWITPEVEPRRYDTHFFLAPAPLGQTLVHDAGEATEAIWIRPSDALDQARDGRRQVMFPTRLNLEVLAGWTSVAQALEGARARTVVPILPQITVEGGQMRVRIDSGLGYASTEDVIAFPGR
jgi:8-oxo-dGTP pyrophosphatase MutT (NUDIX family)